MELPTLILRKDQERRLLAGHQWVYSNEVDIKRSPLKNFTAGDAVAIVSQRGKLIGNGYVNPNSLICARLVSRRKNETLDQSLLEKRIGNALKLRQRLFDAPHYRLVFGESDLLPGLVIDRFGDYIIVQITTAGMEAVHVQIVSALEKLLNPKGILLRNDVPIREQEGLSQYVRVASGDVPETLEVIEDGYRFLMDPHHGQKSGWFFDQAANRRQMRSYVKDAEVLDICSYVGAWGVQAAAAGATSATCVDSSQTALDFVEQNAQLNGVQEKVHALRGDAFEVLKNIKSEQRKFDVIMLDPPAFIKRRKDLKEGTQAYRRLNELGIELLKPGGILITSSCSFHMSRDELLNVVRQGAVNQHLDLQLLEHGQQRQDHPVLPAIPETAYLKTLFLHKMLID